MQELQIGEDEPMREVHGEPVQRGDEWGWAGEVQHHGWQTHLPFPQHLHLQRVHRLGLCLRCQDRSRRASQEDDPLELRPFHWYYFNFDID